MPFKNRWPWRVAARVALERPAEGFEGFEGGQTAGLNALKNRWGGRVAARVALERPAGRFGRGSCRGALEAFEAWQTASTQTSNCCWNDLGQCESHGRDKAGSTPPVVLGAAPALAKAGVGG